jgi:hypothetical protein
MKKPKPPPPLKFDLLSYLLGQYGYGHMSEEDFWRRMREHGYVQDDIDWWCKEDQRRDDDARERKEIEDRAARGTTPRDESSPRRR